MLKNREICLEHYPSSRQAGVDEVHAGDLAEMRAGGWCRSHSPAVELCKGGVKEIT